jgi:hypothetical protein
MWGRHGSDNITGDDAHPKGERDALLAAVLHELKLAVRGHKADHLLRIKAPQVHTLMEGHILQQVTDVERGAMQQIIDQGKVPSAALSDFELLNALVLWCYSH